MVCVRSSLSPLCRADRLLNCQRHWQSANNPRGGKLSRLLQLADLTLKKKTQILPAVLRYWKILPQSGIAIWNLVCQFYLSFIGRFSFKRKRFPSFLILPISVLLRSRLNNRGEYLSYRDPEWWIQSNNTPWRNPYARWGNENGTSLYEERYIRPEFVVSVDTSNPIIRRLLENGLNVAEDMIREKASFAIEVR